MFNDISPLWISLKTSLIATTITFFLGIIAAYWMLGYRGKWRSIIEGIFILPLILPPTVVGFLFVGWLTFNYIPRVICFGGKLRKVVTSDYTFW